MTDLQTYRFVAKGQPRVKERPRMTRRGKAYTPETTLLAEDALKKQYKGPKFDGPIEVSIELQKDHQVITITEIESWENDSKLRGDVDNYAKLTLDALNKIAFNDDRQVKAFSIVKM